MRAKFVFEKFEEESDPIRDLNIGYSAKVLNTMSWKILEFIKNKGEEGASLTEIQFFIWTELEGHDPKKFWEKEYIQAYNYKTQDTYPTVGRRTRGHWNTQLYGTRRHIGLLNKYCKKNEKGKWVFVKYPKPDEKFYR
jgi:hypothetical protein